MNGPEYRYHPTGCQSLLGYGKATHERSGGVCIYCGLGKDRVQFDVWRQLSIDHVIPARLFPGQGRSLRSIFPNMPKSELKSLHQELNRINLVTACNFCNSMTSRMKDISADGILPSEGLEQVTSIQADPVRGMLRRLRKRVKEVLPIKRDYVQKRLASLQAAFETEVKGKLQDAREPGAPATDDVLGAIDLLGNQLLNCRVFFPKLDKRLIGQSEFQSPSFYEDVGYKVRLKFAKPLTGEDLDHLNAVGHFINRSYVALLYSVLEFHHVLAYDREIDETLDGAKDAQLLRDLRNVIVHRAGEYDATNTDHRRLYRRIQKRYGVDDGSDPQNAHAFPLPIDQVLLAMTRGCRTYAEAILKRGSECTSSTVHSG